MMLDVTLPRASPDIARRPDQGRLNNAVAAQTKTTKTHTVIQSRWQISTEVPPTTRVC